MNMSSGGVLVASLHQLDTGIGLELNIQWPYLLEGQIPLQLVAAGTVVHCEKSGFVLQLTRHQFRTARKTSLKVKPRAARISAAGGSWTATPRILRALRIAVTQLLDVERTL